jgi:iron(III) transport system substrate-binding protein
MAFVLFSPFAFAAASDVLKAQNTAQGKGFLFIASHDEIVAKAKAEGQLRALSSMDNAIIKAAVSLFKKKYPFIDIYVEETAGEAAGQRFLTELKAGMVNNWDIMHIATDFYNEHLPYVKKIDVRGMAEHGVLDIPPEMVDTQTRAIVTLTGDAGAVAYNKNLIAPEKVPDKWDDFLRPEFKGRKFIVDIRPKTHSDLVPAMGLEWVLSYCKKLAAQEPIWVRGGTRSLAAMAAGEYALHSGIDYNSIMRNIHRDRTNALQVKILEPVPIRLSEPETVLHNAAHPHAALLWLEFLGSAEGQAIIDKVDMTASIYSPASAQYKMLQGKKVSLVEVADLPKKPHWMQEIVKAFGFPKAERIKKK